MKRCWICEKEITLAHELGEEVRTLNDGEVHADCYYTRLGHVIEEHPIPNPAPTPIRSSVP